MKNLRKALAAVLALTVMSVSATAFAEVSATGSFDKAAVTADYSEIAQNKVTATVATASATTGTQMTFLILDDGTDVTDIEEADILYIDQKELANGSNWFTGVINLARVNGGVGAAELPEGSYPIRLGYTDSTGEFAIAAATMVVAEASLGTTITIVWGDITGDSVIDSDDALAALLKYVGNSPQYTVAGQTATVGAQFAGYLWGDITGDSVIDSDDALAALLKYVGNTPQYTVNGNTLTVGSTIEATIED